MRPTLYLYLALAASVTLNLAAGWQSYQNRALVDAHCRKLDRYACAMQPTVISFALEPQTPAAPTATADSDPIANLIQEATAHGLPLPPKSN